MRERLVVGCRCFAFMWSLGSSVVLVQLLLVSAAWGPITSNVIEWGVFLLAAESLAFGLYGAIRQVGIDDTHSP